MATVPGADKMLAVPDVDKMPAVPDVDKMVIVPGVSKMVPVPSANRSQRLALDAEYRADALRVGVIGYGYWGPNVVRNFHGQDQSRVVAVCDRSPKSMQRVRKAHPEIPVTSNFNDLLTATDIDAIAVVTPAVMRMPNVIPQIALRSAGT